VAPAANAFDIAEAYSAKGVNSMTTPFVGDIDGDSIPEIIACINTSKSPYFSSGFFVINGRTGEVEDTLNTVSYNTHGQCMAFADVDKDRKAELFLLGEDMYAYCYSNTGELKWKSENVFDNRYLLSVADVNNDGEAELVCGRYIYNAKTGKLLINATLENDGKGFMSPHNLHVDKNGIKTMSNAFYMYALANFNYDNNLEMAAGNTLYKIVLTNNEGTEGNSMTVLRQAKLNDKVDVVDGGSIVLDFDNDGDLDICTFAKEVDGGSLDNHKINIYVWEGQSSDLIAYQTIESSFRGPTIPFCADINGDNHPEIIFNTANGMNVLYYDLMAENSMSLKVVPDYKESAAYTAFDFNQDGKAELVYRGDNNLFLIDGATLKPLCDSIQAFSGTIAEFPVVADVDADGHAEIVLTRAYKEWNNDDSEGYLSVYKSKTPGAWGSARKVWNQTAYNSVNINEDLTVPQTLFDIATDFPNGKSPFNAFLQQMPYINTNGDLFTMAPDLTIAKVPQFRWESDTLTGSFSIKNIGSSESLSPLYISYFSDYKNRDLLKTDTLTDIVMVDSILEIKAKFPSDFHKNVTIAINDKRLKGHQPECNFENNVSNEMTVVRYCPEKNSIIDTVIWCKDTFTIGNSKFYISGNYDFVMFDKTDNCESTVDLTLAVLEKTTTEIYDTIFIGEAYRMFGFDTLQTELGDFTYTQTLQNFKGCDSIVSLHLHVICKDYDIKLNDTICANEFYRFDNKRLIESGHYELETKTIWGCDSFVTLDLVVLDTALTFLTDTTDQADYNEYGFDLHLTEGGWQEFFLHRTNIHGCDSIVVLNLLVIGDGLPTIKEPEEPEYEDYTICSNDSLVIGDYVLRDTGRHEIILKDRINRDSIAYIYLKVNEISRDTLIDNIRIGETYNSNGFNLKPTEVGKMILTNILPNSNGCDSIVTLVLTVKDLDYDGEDDKEGDEEDGEGDGNEGEGEGGSGSEGDGNEGESEGEGEGGNGSEGDGNGGEGEGGSGSEGDGNEGEGEGGNGSEGDDNGGEGEGGNGSEGDGNEGEGEGGSGSEGDGNGGEGEGGNGSEGDGNEGEGEGGSGSEGDGNEGEGEGGNGSDGDGNEGEGEGGIGSGNEYNDDDADYTDGVLEMTICGNETFRFGEQVLNTSGVYTRTIVDEQGAEKEVTLNLTVLDTSVVNITAYGEIGKTFDKMGFFITPTKKGKVTETLHLTKQNGCDSTVILTLIVDCVSTDTILKEYICENESYYFAGETLTESGTYTLNTIDQNGCDSLVTLILTVGEMTTNEIEETILVGSSFNKLGFDLPIQENEGEFTYTLNTLSQYGCDSTVILKLNVVSNLDGKLIPTVFTPHLQDGLNDVFMKGYDVYIYDRYGNLISYGNDGWDGKYKGEYATPGVYIYILTMKDGRKEKGTIEVVKVE
jgi:gliding motility-associated-like protein